MKYLKHLLFSRLITAFLVTYENADAHAVATDILISSLRLTNSLALPHPIISGVSIEVSTNQGTYWAQGPTMHF